MAYESPLGYRARSPRRMRLVLVLLGLAVFVCGVGAAGLGAWNYQSVRRAAGPAREAADGFLREVAADDLAAAYDRLCPATRERMNPEVFAQRIHALPKIGGYAIRDVRVSTDRGEFRGTVDAQLTWDSGVVEDHALELVTDKGRWQVCGDPF
jgi:hypothetical protein